MIGATQLYRVDAVALAQIVIADVVEVPPGAEIPAGAGVSLNAALPVRMVHRDLDLVRDVGERQAFAGEPTAARRASSGGRK